MTPRSAGRASAPRPRREVSRLAAYLGLLFFAALLSVGPLGSAFIGPFQHVAFGVGATQPGSSPGPALAMSSVGPNLSLRIDQAIGTAPFFANITATAHGGQPPYNLTFCSAAPGSNCERNTVWNGLPWKMEISLTSPGNFTVNASVIDSTGSGGSASVAVVVLAVTPVIAHPSEASASGTAPFTDSFQAIIAGGRGPYAVTWSFGDGTQNTSHSLTIVNHTYSQAGDYTPRITVRDSQDRVFSQALPTVRVINSPGSGPGPSVAGIPSNLLPLLLGGVAIVVVVAGTGTYVWRERKVRKESYELVSQLWEGDDGGPEDEPGP